MPPGKADDDTIAEAQRHRDELREAMPGPPALERIAVRLDLSEFEREVLLMCAGAELDTAFAHACAAAQGDPPAPMGRSPWAVLVIWFRVGGPRHPHQPHRHLT